MKEKVSIIVPIYNVENYLKKCIDSLVKQTYKNIEIFLVDDGSPDNCGKICDELAKKDKRIKVVHKENGGYGSVLEYSINNISSEYFLICDPDDWLEKNAVEKLITAMKDYDTDLVVGRKNLVYSDGKISSDKNDFSVLKSDIKYTDLSSFLNIPCSPHSKLYKTSLCKKILFPKKVNNTDYLLYQVYLTKISSAVFIDEELSNYYIDRPGNSFNEDSNLTEKSLKSNAIVTLETYKQLDEKSRIYSYSVLTLFVRSCRYLALMKKYNVYNEEYEKTFLDVINNSKKYKNELSNYMNMTTSSKSKASLKFKLYSMFYTKGFRNIATKILSVKIK